MRDIGGQRSFHEKKKRCRGAGMDPVLTYLLDNFWYYLLSCVTLFFWDLIDLYVELRNFDFILNFTFGAYYLIRVFFCLALMEIGFVIGLFSLPSKVVMAFVVPLSFSAILQNLVVKVGGVERSINFGEVFDRFKFRIKDALDRRNTIDKVLRQRRLLVSRNVSNNTILKTCRLYADKKEDFEELVNRTKDSDNESKRLEYIVWLTDQAGTVDIAHELIEEVRASEMREGKAK